MKIGIIIRVNTELNPNSDKFIFREATCTRKINTKGDRIFSKLLYFPYDYEEVKNNTDYVQSGNLMVVGEPVFLSDEIKEKMLRWIDWANKASPEEYELI